mmetsp:Transcript_11294/g.15821  ORF Transcript_11294/g.15821 Transcript_11294/m.15821 type:complete len:408 (+) Transcript_11294:257-1480(+)
MTQSDKQNHLYNNHNQDDYNNNIYHPQQQYIHNSNTPLPDAVNAATTNSPWTTFCQNCCAQGYDPRTEKLEYNYTYQDAQGLKPPQPFPRIRNRGEMYVDSFNDQSWNCSLGTNEEAGTWMNSGDQAGTIMAALVWLLMIYSAATVTLLSLTGGIPVSIGMIYCVLVMMALASHAKTSLTDPGSVPRAAVPVEMQRQAQQSHSMCGQCQTFKPPQSHHCRICNRCVSRMDHHCPWMNNCVGAANLKHFILFLCYTWSCSAFALSLFGSNYFFCSVEECTFHPVIVHLVRVMTVLCIGSFLFTSSMIMNVTYGILTGIGTIDRLKKKATNTMSQSDEEPIALTDVFGVGGYYTWPFPVDPVFEDHDHVLGYSMPQRLAREQQLMERIQPLVRGKPQTVHIPLCGEVPV